MYEAQEQVHVTKMKFPAITFKSTDVMHFTILNQSVFSPPEGRSSTNLHLVVLFRSIMNAVVGIVCVLFVLNLVEGDVGDLCTLKSTGSQGECKLFKDCQVARQDLLQNKRFPQTCGFQRIEPIVCCTESSGSIETPTTTTTASTTATPETLTTSRPQRKPGEISIQKCREYSQFCTARSVPLIGDGLVREGEFPHMAIIGYEPTPGDIQWLCGGATISEQFVLTAGHCLAHKELGEPKYVRIGITNLHDKDHLQEFGIVEHIKYPDYTPSSHYHDIGLIKLDKPLRVNRFTVPSCLYTGPKVTTDQATATGWGKTEFAGDSSDDLLKVTLDLFSHKECNQSYINQINRKLKRGIVDDLQLCAGTKDEDKVKDTCQGDSGGPLQIHHTSDDMKCMYDVIAVASFGKVCSGSSGVYTRVSTYIQWIEDTVWP